MKLRVVRFLKVGLFAFFAIVLFAPIYAFAASQVDISGPTGSGTLGKFIAVLSNGNFVVADPEFGSGGGNNGAVYLYNGQTGR